MKTSHQLTIEFNDRILQRVALGNSQEMFDRVLEYCECIMKTADVSGLLLLDLLRSKLTPDSGD